MDRAAAIIVTSNRYMESSEELQPWRHKCRIIPLGIDIQKHILVPDMSARVREIHKVYGERIIVAVGRLVPYKGFDVLIRAMKAVDAKLLLIGSGPQERQLMELRNSERLQNKIEILSRVEHVAPYYRAADVFVLPSLTRAEAFGLVQVEAMALGLPVVNTYLDSGVPEVSVDGVTGSTVLPGDSVALAHAIQSLLDNPALRNRMGEAAKQRAYAQYTVDHMAQQTTSLYREILS
jgi:rhamnosyl/mannosyltransferase